jgi:putative ABC transport system substrate-binding protein
VNPDSPSPQAWFFAEKAPVPRRESCFKTLPKTREIRIAFQPSARENDVFMNLIGKLLRNLWLGITLIVAASALLLLSDRAHRGRSPAADARAQALTSVRIVCLMESVGTEGIREGILTAFREAGLADNPAFECRYLGAHGEISLLPGLIDSVRADAPDLTMTITTPALQAAIARLPGQRIVFSGVANACAAGAGEDEVHHLPNVTGVVARIRYDEMAQCLHRMMPSVRNVGALYNPAETNSVVESARLAAELEKVGIALTLVPINSAQEIPQAADVLCTREIDAVCQMGDNTVSQGYASILQCAERANLPVFGFEGSMIAMGAVAVMSRDFYDVGVTAGRMAVRVLNGEDPAKIPFSAEQSLYFLLNEPVAEKFHLNVPKDLRKRAEKDRKAYDRSHPQIVQ